jgi:hypothetical protein
LFPKIIISSEWYYFVLSLLAAAAVSLWLYYRNKKNTEVPRRVLVGLAVLRFLGITLVLLLLLNIFLRRLQNETQNPVVLLAIDNSSSMTAGADSAFVKTAFLNELQALRKNISEKFSVKTILFGSQAGASEALPDFSDKETDIENLVSDVDNNYSNQNIGALVIVSDGIYNKGASPVPAAEKLNCPVYAVAMGDTSEPKDVILQKTDHNQVAYLGNNFPVEVTLRAKKYRDREVSVSLLHNGVEKSKQSVKINSDDFLGTCNFTLNAESPGLVKYTAKVSLLEGEKSSANNVQSFVMEVIDNREKILLLAGAPHPDVAALKNVITNSTAYELEYGLAGETRKPLKPYSLVIIHGYNASHAGLVSECKTNGVPFWIINPSVSDNLPGLRITGAINRGSNDAEPVPGKSFGLFALSDELKKFMKDLPAVKTPFGNYSLNANSESLINQRIGVVETENPILLFTSADGVKAAVFLGDGLWKWGMRDFEAHNNHNLFQELVSKSIQYLSVKSDKSFFRITAPKLVNENEPISLGAEVYNKSYELITEPDVTLELSNAEHKKFNYTFSKTNNAYRLNLGLLAAGEYAYTARVKVNNELFVKQGLILVKEVVAEKINTVANHNLLYQLARRTNGKLFLPGELKSLQQTLLNNELIKPITYSQTSTTLLLDLKWLFWVILGLFTVEWFFRKRFLSI